MSEANNDTANNFSEFITSLARFWNSNFWSFITSLARLKFMTNGSSKKISNQIRSVTVRFCFLLLSYSHNATQRVHLQWLFRSLINFGVKPFLLSGPGFWAFRFAQFCCRINPGIYNNWIKSLAFKWPAFVGAAVQKQNETRNLNIFNVTIVWMERLESRLGVMINSLHEVSRDNWVQDLGKPHPEVESALWITKISCSILFESWRDIWGLSWSGDLRFLEEAIMFKRDWVGFSSLKKVWSWSRKWKQRKLLEIHFKIKMDSN